MEHIKEQSTALSCFKGYDVRGKFGVNFDANRPLKGSPIQNEKDAIASLIKYFDSQFIFREDV